MNKLVKPGRIVILFLIMAILLSIYGSALYKIQVTDSEEYLAGANADTVTTTTRVAAARGNILDRNGILLISNTISYNITLSRDEILESDDPNDVVIRLVDTAEEYGVDFSDTFPVTRSAPFSYSTTMTETDRQRLLSYLEYFGLDENISASDLIVWMKDHYGLDYTTSLNDVRSAIGIRYELELRVISNIPDYVFASDVELDFITVLLEGHFPGVHVVPVSEREYHTKYAAHILGTVGLMDEEEYETYKEQDYPMDAVVGKSGVEYAFEEYLHGTDGSVTTTTDKNGSVVDERVNTEVAAGNNVYLTIDIELQSVAERALAETIAALNATRKEGEELADGAAVVVTDVRTGEILVSASYPSYDIETYYEDFELLAEDDTLPLFNRATLGIYNPGSTFKPVTAYAALKSGTIDRYTPITDEGLYTAYEDFQPACWVYPGSHGTLDVVGALENSCNYFFYTVSDQMGIDVIADAAAQFGLGSGTGIEVPESVGQISTPEYKRDFLDEDWWAADTLLAAIGQSHNQFTPVQLAIYASAIANGGTVYNATLLNSVRSSDYATVVFDNAPKIKNQIDDPEGYIEILQEGMTAVAATGTAADAFADYPVPVAAKTGTVQSDSATVNSGVFICYAPADNPEIAIAIVVENGKSGASLTDIAREILDSYFASDVIHEFTSEENTLLS